MVTISTEAPLEWANPRSILTADEFLHPADISRYNAGDYTNTNKDRQADLSATFDLLTKKGTGVMDRRDFLKASAAMASGPLFTCGCMAAQ